MVKNKIVIKIGGSLLFEQNNSINSQRIIEICDIIKENFFFETIIIIVGGGIIAREYIKFIRQSTQNEALSDIIGIDVSRLNAKLLISYLNDKAYPIVPKSIEEFSIAKLSDKIIIMGGLQPGQSTTSVALEVAEFIHTKKVIILTNVDGIYNKDPKKYNDAKIIKKLNYEELKEFIITDSKNNQAAAGEYRIFDAVSLQILKRSNIKVFIGSGLDLSNFKKFWNGELENFGTIISD
ncbi:MAG: UMP kinase [Candidatus Lokiarchaeota archaeon]|nr:UMP kinase [Candidatus Lokiarchaeota archaeon]